LWFVFDLNVRLKKYEKTNGSTQLVKDHNVAGAHHSLVKSVQKSGMCR